MHSACTQHALSMQAACKQLHLRLAHGFQIKVSHINQHAISAWRTASKLRYPISNGLSAAATDEQSMRMDGISAVREWIWISAVRDGAAAAAALAKGAATGA